MIRRESDNHDNIDDDDDDDDNDDGDDGYDNVDGRSNKLRLTFKVKRALLFLSLAIPSSQLSRQGVVQRTICFLKEVLKEEWRGYILAVIPLYLWLHVL